MQTLSATKVKLELSGAVNMEVKAPGKTNVLIIGASGASNYHGKLLNAAQADVEASGASNIDIYATEFLQARASGASNIRYLGQPKLKSNASGASHIKAIND